MLFVSCKIHRVGYSKSRLCKVALQSPKSGLINHKITSKRKSRSPIFQLFLSPFQTMDSLSWMTLFSLFIRPMLLNQFSQSSLFSVLPPFFNTPFVVLTLKAQKLPRENGDKKTQKKKTLSFLYINGRSLFGWPTD